MLGKGEKKENKRPSFLPLEKGGGGDPPRARFLLLSAAEAGGKKKRDRDASFRPTRSVEERGGRNSISSVMGSYALDGAGARGKKKGGGGGYGRGMVWLIIGSIERGKYRQLLPSSLSSSARERREGGSDFCACMRKPR